MAHARRVQHTVCDGDRVISFAREAIRGAFMMLVPVVLVSWPFAVAWFLHVAVTG